MSSATESRVLVFGLHRGDSADDLIMLMGPCPAPRLDICEVPGDSGQAFAVLHLQPDPLVAWRMAQRLGSRRLHGRRLQAWVTAMPWT